jgi:hypothetical protein
MADQIAISLDNARLYAESVRQLQELSQSTREKTFTAWQEEFYARRTTALLAEVGTATANRDDLTELASLRRQAMQTGRTAVGRPTERNTMPLAVPVILRGQVLGAVEWELPASDFTQEKVALAEELVGRLTLSLDNARLFEQSQRVIARERVVNSIAAKLAGQTNVQEILQIAVREVGQALRAPEVNIQLRLAGNRASQANGANGSTNGANGSGDHRKNGADTPHPTGTHED